MSRRRPWLAAVVVFFCVPLFVGLGDHEVEHDEAIYSFAVDTILETGDWLQPKSIPSEDVAFLEKPPLKFWIVAAPIRLGLLPHDEFGRRFWDAFFGAIAFVYVFLIGTRLIGPVCGAVAVLLLFTHAPLVFFHGLRANDMEAALFLAYCGGVYHFTEWLRMARQGTPPPDGSRRHAVVVGLYFVLGFMTKFVAVVFLPLVLIVGTLFAPADRRVLLRAWRVWVAVALLALALIAPWFVWGSVRYGTPFWSDLVGQHVIVRFTSYLDPAHVQPWYYYPMRLYEELVGSGVAMLTAAGLITLLVQAIRRRWTEGLIVVLWLVLPLFLISFGTSKLYHYAYPFVPGAALAAGYLVALVLLVGLVPFRRWMEAVQTGLSARLPRLREAVRRPVPRAAWLLLAAVGMGVAAYSVTLGPIRFEIGGVTIRSSGIFRPMLAGVFFGMLGSPARGASHVMLWLLLIALMPLPGYRRAIVEARSGRHPMETARECVETVGAEGAGPGLYVDVPPTVMSHPMYYHFRRVRPWVRPEGPAPQALGRYLTDPAEMRPILVWEPTYLAFRETLGLAGQERGGSAASVVFQDVPNDVLLLLPGPYAVCAARAEEQRRVR